MMPLRTFGLRADGTLLRDGLPFLMLGAYYLTYSSGGLGAVRDAEVARGLGLNTLIGNWTYHPATDQALLTRAAELDIGVVYGDLTGDDVGVLSGKAGAYGFQSADDANTHVSPAQALAESNKARALNPGQLTYLSQCTGLPYALGARADYAGAAMVIGNQIYPVPGDPLHLVASEMEIVAADCQAASPRTCPVVNVQLYDNGARHPTPAEVSCMVAQAMIGGARGVVYYAPTDQNSRLHNRADHLRNLRRLNVLLASHAAFWLDGARTRLTTRDTWVVAAKWTLGGRTLVWVTNCADERRPVSVDLGASYTSVSGGSLELRGSRLCGELPGHGGALVTLR